MKRRILHGLGSIQRPVALMLMFLPIGSLAATYFLTRWTRLMAAQGAMGDPNIVDVLDGFGTLFREYALPVLCLTVVLSVLNLLTAFAARAQKVRT